MRALQIDLLTNGPAEAFVDRHLEALDRMAGQGRPRTVPGLIMQIGAISGIAPSETAAVEIVDAYNRRQRTR